MKTKNKIHRQVGLSRWMVVVLFAIAMAWVESAVVYYLRTMIDRIQPYQSHPLPLIGGLGKAELIREAATLTMILAVGILAGRRLRTRLGYAAIAFGVWDIFYYIFLKVLCNWPHSLWDWDILFLLPLPWWGPVLAPVSIAILMIVWGTLVSTWPVEASHAAPAWKPWFLNCVGIVLALYLFMADSIRVASHGAEALRNTLPAVFNWWVFSLALALMAAPILHLLMRLALNRSKTVQPLNAEKWIAYFKHNAERRPEPDWSQSFELKAGILGPLLRSLEQFELGDGGGPASLIAHDSENFRGSSSRMPNLVDCLFREEREHSRLLGCAVKHLGGKKISGHWSFSAFCACRRIFGVRFELQVLLLTEITSTAYYRLLKRHSPIPALAATCALILRDEAGHIAFHRDRLVARGFSGENVRDWLWRIQFYLGGYGAATMLWINHRKCLCALGGSTGEFYHEVAFELRRFWRALGAGQNVLIENELNEKDARGVPECSL